MTLIGTVLISDLIKKDMQGMDVSVLMGANLANEVADMYKCVCVCVYVFIHTYVLMYHTYIRMSKVYKS